ncbi:MAG: glycosyltransferase family 39 protein [Gammaproteobacteria bacterium]|nr:glycosyltransferase family 39 protein [Gammaproteobacteria bacterium]
MRDDNNQAIGVPVFRLFGIGMVLVLGLKLYLGTVLDLYSDEVFYWLASTHPAIAYSDLPFMTSLLVGLGASLDPGNAFAVRIVFLILGSSIPLLLYWIARPICNRQQALESAALCLCLPLGGFLGLLAVPDVPLLFFGLLAIGCFERALRVNDLKFWIGTGICVALGLSTHYRFFLYPSAALLYLVLYKPARIHWANPRLWLSMAIASIGLIPIIWFNLTHALSSASFYFVDRHPWEFQISGLLHVFKQAGLVTPPLYAVFLLTLWTLLQRARQQDQVAALMLYFATVNIAVYLLLAPWTDATSTSIHWPLSGYFPLLVFVPAVLRQCYAWCREKWSERVARRLIASVPVLGFTGTLVALLGVGSQAHQEPLQSLLGPGILSNKMAGWKQFSSHTGALLRDQFQGDLPVLITDNYYTAAQLEFAGLTEDAYTLDRDKAVRDGRITQFQLWGKDESAVVGNTINRSVLYINEDSSLTVVDKHELLTTICSFVDSMKFIDELSLFRGDKRFSYYSATRIIDNGSNTDYRARPCPYPARAWIDYPNAEEHMSGSVNVSGWSYNEDIGIADVYLLLDGTRIGTADYGQERPDVVQAMGVSSDPNEPALGFSYSLDTTSITNGEYHLSIELINRQGMSTVYGERTVQISN